MTDVTEPYSGPIVTRAEAIRLGLKWYFHGRPCRRGHLVQRRTRDQSCPECQRIVGRTRYALDPEPYRQKTRSRYASDPERFKKSSQDYRAEHPGKNAASYQLWYSNPENALRKSLYRATLHAADPSISRRQSEAWRANNPKAAKAISARCYRKNPIPAKLNAKIRRVRMLGVEGSHTEEEITDLFVKQKGKCAYCLIKLTMAPKNRNTVTEDHVVAVTAGGSNHIGNIALCCKSCNSKKNAKDPFVFARKLGRLL